MRGPQSLKEPCTLDSRKFAGIWFTLKWYWRRIFRVLYSFQVSYYFCHNSICVAFLPLTYFGIRIKKVLLMIFFTGNININRVSFLNLMIISSMSNWFYLKAEFIFFVVKVFGLPMLNQRKETTPHEIFTEMSDTIPCLVQSVGAVEYIDCFLAEK